MDSIFFILKRSVVNLFVTILFFDIFKRVILLFISTSCPINSSSKSHSFSLHLSLPRTQYCHKMSGVWVFKDGIIRLNDSSTSNQQSLRKRVLVHLPTSQVISSYNMLEEILRQLGWERYFGGDFDLFQFHKKSSIDLISLPKDFSKFSSIYMYDIVVKNPNVFHVREC